MIGFRFKDMRVEGDHWDENSDIPQLGEGKK